MKKSILLSLIVLIPLLAIGQNSAVDKLFKKYGGRDGFTTITINQGLLKMLSQLDENDEDIQALAGIKTIKILAVEDDAKVKEINFYDEVMSKLKASDYEELMTVDNKDENVVFLAKKDGDIITELILVVGGDEDNALVYIAGSIRMKDVAKISKSIGVNGSIKVPGL
ncbi:MAG: DUF4252 domain-containing protein [Bacteroidales bacterium]|nr:DUF4252 domain-containing protein [Bacteroidales bacterium]